MKLIITLLILIPMFSLAKEKPQQYKTCLAAMAASVKKDTTAQEIRQKCTRAIEGSINKLERLGAISKRILAERQSQWNPFSITPHRRNFVMPVQITDRVNRTPYKNTNDWGDKLKNKEVKFQLSMKVPLNSEDLFAEFDSLYFAFTVQAWWQMYTDELSSPFRETNYQPEVFYMRGMDWHPFGGNTGIGFGIEHQSNGRSGELSRSWNRGYAFILFEHEKLAVSTRFWHRLEEEQKLSPTDTQGDDNPDILDYMGNMEVSMIYGMQYASFAMTMRNNLQSNNKGSIKMSTSFPVWGHLKGYVEYFNGYGESLINYNHHQQSFGIGILLTDIM